MPTVIFTDLGLKPYEEALAIQLKHFESIKAIKIKNRGLEDANEAILPTPNFFFFVEHPHVYTMGRNGNEGNLLLSEVERNKKGVAYFRTNRGGDSTYHGPGQVVGYPVLDLDNFSADIHKYMRDLEEVVMLTIAKYGLKGERSKGETGVWLDVGTDKARKICAMGVHTSRWVTMHGFALNVNTDLSFFTGIIPCGIKNKGVTSLANELGKELDEESVKKELLKNFTNVFAMKFVTNKAIDL